jgi:site-specific DNA recombinase
MINQDEFHRIQMLRSGKKIAYKYNRHNPNFPLRRTVLCSTCLRPLTGSSPRNGAGKHFDYYHCYNRQCSRYGRNFSKATLEDKFLEQLSKITPKDKFLQIFEETVLNHWSKQGQHFNKEADAYKAQLDIFEAKRKAIFEMREDGSYTTEEFKERKAEIENKIVTAKISMSESKIEQFDIELALAYAKENIKNMPTLWQDLAPEIKPKFQKMIFPSGIPFDLSTGFGTARLGCIYELNRQSSANYSNVVDRTGLEPATPSLQMRCSTR